jgi:hypothetical protein
MSAEQRGTDQPATGTDTHQLDSFESDNNLLKVTQIK